MSSLQVKLLCNKMQNSDSDLSQVFLPISASVYQSSFFPDSGFHFTVLADDGVLFFCVRSQSNGEGIESVGSNSKIGKYIRSRLGLSSGAPVTAQDLLKYGRTTIDFYKIDDENFYLDFSVK